MNLLQQFSHCPMCGQPTFARHTEKSLKCSSCGFEFFLNPAAAVVAVIVNEEGHLLVERRRLNPAKGTLDLPGGFCDLGETAEEAVVREVMEETGLTVGHADYLFSRPNVYPYSGIDVHTLDLFYECRVEAGSVPVAADDAAECFWAPLSKVDVSQFGLQSIRQGLQFYMESRAENLKK